MATRNRGGAKDALMFVKVNPPPWDIVSEAKRNYIIRAIL